MYATLPDGEISQNIIKCMGDPSRQPTTEAEALSHKFLLQHLAEQEAMRKASNENLPYIVAVSLAELASRMVHGMFVLTYPQFRHTKYLSYAFDRENMQPGIRPVDSNGYYVASLLDVAPEHDIERDEVVQQAMEIVFKHHMRVYEDHTFEFVWETCSLNMEFVNLNEPAVKH
jgi:hypothetical protein